MKDEFKSEYINFEENKKIELEFMSDETRTQRFKKNKETGEPLPNKPYNVWEFNVVNLENNTKGKISLFKNKVAELYKQLDKSNGKDNKSLIGSKFSFTNIVTETNDGKKYDLIVKLISTTEKVEY